jgi:hypothetical protein
MPLVRLCSLLIAVLMLVDFMLREKIFDEYTSDFIFITASILLFNVFLCLAISWRYAKMEYVYVSIALLVLSELLETLKFH